MTCFASTSRAGRGVLFGVLLALAMAAASCTDPLSVDTPRKIDIVGGGGGAPPSGQFYQPDAVRLIIVDNGLSWLPISAQIRNVLIDTTSRPPRIIIEGFNVIGDVPGGSLLRQMKFTTDTLMADAITVPLVGDPAIGPGVEMLVDDPVSGGERVLISNDVDLHAETSFEVDPVRRVINGHVQARFDDPSNPGSRYTVDLFFQIEL